MPMTDVQHYIDAAIAADRLPALEGCLRTRRGHEPKTRALVIDATVNEAGYRAVQGVIAVVHTAEGSIKVRLTVRTPTITTRDAKQLRLFE
jgi:hypothetical protein